SPPFSGSSASSREGSLQRPLSRAIQKTDAAPSRAHCRCRGKRLGRIFWIKGCDAEVLKDPWFAVRLSAATSRLICLSPDQICSGSSRSRGSLDSSPEVIASGPTPPDSPNSLNSPISLTLVLHWCP